MGFLDILQGGDASGGGSWWQNLNSGRKDNRNALIMAGLGIMSGQTPQAGFSNAMKGFMQGREMDVQERHRKAKTAQTNKTDLFFQQNSPEHYQMVQSGMDRRDALNDYFQRQRKAKTTNKTIQAMQQLHPDMSEETAQGLIASGEYGEWLKPQKAKQQRIVKGPDNRNYYEDGSLVLPNVQAPQSQTQYPKGLENPDAQKAYDKAMGKAKAETMINAPKAIAEGEQVLKTIADIKSDPNREWATGWSGMLLGNWLPGTDQYDFQMKVDQLKGQAFLSAFERLKGGGQITQIEGEKATQALARLQTSQSDEAFLQALNDFEQNVKLGLLKKRQEIGQDDGLTDEQLFQMYQP